MAFALSEHIRSLRKARGLTQEQLAEALGVTAGAVYKWESRLSLPELPMLVQLADFFDTSVDALSELLCHRLSGGGDDAGFRAGAERQSLDGARWKPLGRGPNALTPTRVTT